MADDGMELDVAGAGREVNLPLVAEGEDEMINQVRAFQLLSHPGPTPADTRRHPLRFAGEQLAGHFVVL